MGISLTSLENVVFRYQLSGIDETWQETRARSVSYPYLPPGEYNFSISARNEDGLWSENPLSLDFRIDPPFWETLWFRIGSLIVIAGILAVAHRKRVDHLKLELKSRETGRAVAAQPGRLQISDQ